jgi:hypothetical protein
MCSSDWHLFAAAMTCGELRSTPTADASNRIRPSSLVGSGWKPANSTGPRSCWAASGRARSIAWAAWQAIRRSAASAGRDPATLRRELRITTSPGTPVDDTVQVALTARDAGYEGAFIDLSYIATGVDHALDLAARAMELYEKG